MKTAAVYYSRFGHNAKIVEEAARVLEADTYRIETPKQHGYPVMGFCSTFNVRMRIKPLDLDLSGYDLVVLHTPIWAGKPAPPARTFLREAELEGRRLAVCFSTAGGPTQRAQEKVRQLLAGRNVELVAFGEINTDEKTVSEDEMLNEARLFAERLRELV